MKRKIMTVILIMALLCSVFPQCVLASSTHDIWLDELQILDSDRYTGNMGDSFIDKIGTRNGTIGINGDSYKHGLEAWLARWNFQDELSWVWCTYNLNCQYNTLSGTIDILEKCYNKTNFNTTIEIWGDQDLLFSAILMPGMENMPININVTGVTVLKISLFDNESVSGGTSFALGDFKLSNGTGPDDVGPGKPITPDSSSYIVDRVKEYTSDVMYKQFDNIMTSNDSNEAKYQRLTELFSYYGILDVREGISYLSNTIPERYAYLALTTNEMYANYLAWDWLNFTPAGISYRSVLEADGLTFNNELSTWLDPLTWVGVKDTPGVAKYRDMLYDFMDAQSLEVEITEYISLVSNLANKSTSGGKLYAEALIDELNSCATTEDLQRVITSNNAKKIIADLTLAYEDGSNVPKREFTLSKTSGFGKFAEAMGCATKFLSAYDITVNGIIELIELDGKLAVYAQYQDFLTEIIYATELPWELRLAATKILEEIDSGAWGKVKDLALDLADLTGVPGLVEEDFLTIVLGKTGYGTFDGYLKAIQLTSWCIDQVTDISELVKGAAYMEGYAYLNMYYRNKLINSKLAFLSDQTPENAWKFFENYNLLYQLRCKGEEATLKMFSLKELPAGAQGALIAIFGGYKNDEYEKVIQQTLETLEDCKFTLPDNIKIPESVQYVTKSVISCPVDVEIYAPDGTYVTTLADGRECDVTNEYGRFSVIKRAYTGTYAKVICMSQSGDYTFKLIGQDDGLVDFELTTTLGNAAEVYSFTNSPITQGATFEISTDKIINEQIYDIDTDGDGIVDKTGAIQKVDETSHIPISSIELNAGQIALNKGKSFLLTASVTPENATRKKVIWVTDNEDVASIENGKITANSAGIATIYCISQDNPSILASCVVTIDASSVTSHTISFNANGGFVDISTATTKANGILLNWPIPTHTGYIFDGWYTTASGGKKITTNYVFTSDTTVYAHWIKDSSGSSSGSSSSGGGSSTSHSITTGSFAHGSVSVTPKSASKGTKVTLTIQPDNDYKLDELTVIDSKGNKLELTDKGNGKYTFIMPAGSVKVEANFAAMGTPEIPWVNPFSDVAEGAWYYGAIRFVNENGLMGGYGNGLFGVNDNLSRAQLAQILYNKKGRPFDNEGNNFTDVDTTAWYADAVTWAATRGIVSGYGNGKFGPNDPITREQLAVMLWRYSGSPSVANKELNFSDASAASGYALDALRWVVENGIINGYGDGQLGPKGLATRAQVAQMMMNYLEH